MTNALQELKFYEEYLTKPHCFNTLMLANRQGVLSSKSRGRRVRELVEIISYSNTNPIWFNHDKNRWEVGGSEFDMHGYDYPVERYAPDWVGDKRYKNRTVAVASCDSSGQQILAKTQVNLLYGLELELLVNADISTNYRYGGLRKEVVELFGGGNKAVAKRDGSLEGFEPFELVTVPMTYQGMHKAISKFVNSGTIDKLSVNNTCGIHYHVSREPFNELQTEALLFFCHNTHNTQFFKAVSGRERDTRYCVYKGYVLENHGITKLEHMGRLVNNEPAICLFTDHFDAVSISQRHPTFEFRFFGSTLDKTKLLASFEFVAAICEYVKSGSLVNRWRYQDFLQWFSDPYGTRYKEPDRKVKTTIRKHPHYPHLHEVLVGLGYL